MSHFCLLLLDPPPKNPGIGSWALIFVSDFLDLSVVRPCGFFRCSSFISITEPGGCGWHWQSCRPWGGVRDRWARRRTSVCAGCRWASPPDPHPTGPCMNGETSGWLPLYGEQWLATLRACPATWIEAGGQSPLTKAYGRCARVRWTQSFHDIFSENRTQSMEVSVLFGIFFVTSRRYVLPPN